MKQIISYMADDGTIFDDFEECVKYEDAKTREAAKGQLRFYDYNFQVIADETLSEEKAPQILMDCYYLFMGNEAAIKLADEMGYIASCSTPKKTGYWYYNSKEDAWCLLTRKIEELKEESDTLKYILKNLEVR